MARQRDLSPDEATAVIQRVLMELGYRDPGEQADVVISTLREIIERGAPGGADDRLTVQVLRVFGYSESRIWEMLQEWCREFDRDPTEVFEHIWAPDLEDPRGGGR